MDNNDEPLYNLILQMLNECPDKEYRHIAKAMDIDTKRVRAVAVASRIHAQRILEYQTKWQQLVTDMKEKSISALGKLEPKPDLIEDDSQDIFVESEPVYEVLATMGAAGD